MSSKPPLCKLCGASDVGMFYTSISTYCKEHWKELVRLNRNKNHEYYKEFDRNRAMLPHRVAARNEYRKTERGAAAAKKAEQSYRLRFPEKTKAVAALTRAVMRGKVIPMPCFVCGSKAEAHHPDYSAPLAVAWLCTAHHRQVHAMKL